MEMENDLCEILITAKEIRDKVKEMGAQISRDYKGQNLLMMSVLKGAVVFLADLMREISIHTEVDFMAVSSYGKNTQTSGVVRIVKDLDTALEGYDVLIVEDVLDSGMTLNYLINILGERYPRSIKIAALLDKPGRRLEGVKLDYCGFVIPDEFVVGYGLDYCERYRNLPYIGVLKKEIYQKQ
ncbi:MAG: hypoxanthine phosphoribosyltransferase [Oscillospiraceae bacterium]|nr:hypoxanthine phosphoribosyltransferase [Oscillospiraceae bacterium]